MANSSIEMISILDLFSFFYMGSRPQSTTISGQDCTWPLISRAFLLITYFNIVAIAVVSIDVGDICRNLQGPRPSIFTHYRLPEPALARCSDVIPGRVSSPLPRPGLILGSGQTPEAINSGGFIYALQAQAWVL